MYAIRSMSTTDFDHRVGPASIRPFHTYLKPVGRRAGAWWTTSLSEAEKFATYDAARAELERSYPASKVEYYPGPQIVDLDAKGPAYWESDKVTAAMVTEARPHVFTCDASDIQLRNWTKCVGTTLGNGRPFVRLTKKVDAEGDVEYVRYRQSEGCIDLIVYND